MPRNELLSKLQNGLNAMNLEVSTAQQEKLIDYIYLINKWNKVHNLTAVRDVFDMVTLHLLDSLSVLPFISGKNMLDVGSGAGLPSIPIAICMPELEITAIDAIQKKVSFMRQVKGELGLTNFYVASGRVESLSAEPKYEVIISRAFSEISLFIKLTKHLIAENGQWLAMKGVLPIHEFEKSAIQPTEIKVLNVAGLDAKRHLVFFRPHNV